jgi:hypothetical protein
MPLSKKEKKEIDKELNKVIRLKIDDIMARKYLKLIRTQEGHTAMLVNHNKYITRIVEILTRLRFWK